MSGRRDQYYLNGATMKKTALLLLMIGLIFHTYTLRAEESPSPSESAAPASATTATDEPAAVVSEAPEASPAPMVSAAPEVSPAPMASAMPEASPASEAVAPEAPAAPMASSAPAVVTTATATTATPAVNPAPANSENLEFVSGEVAATDPAAKTVTVKLYGETENATNDKTITVKLDEATDITDGEKDRDIKSLTNGTEVDVEYDPATNKATYIFVY